jgi:hypothetical protein
MTRGELTDRLLELLLEQASARGRGDWFRSLLERDGDDAVVERLSASTLRIRKDGETIELRLQLVPPVELPAAVQPWQPRTLDLPPEELERLSYLVVDEIVGDVARVSVAGWPGVDDRGRLLFDIRERARSVYATVDALERLVAEHVQARRRRSRLAMGSVLAAQVDDSALPEAESEEELTQRVAPEPRSPEEWIKPPVYDIGADAREKAKQAYYAAVAPTIRRTSAK